MPSIRIGLSTQFNLENEQVGIGTTNPTATLEVIGNIVAEGAAGGSGVSTFREYQGFHQSEQGIANNIVIDNQTGGPFSSLSADLVISGETTISSGSTVEIGKTKTLTITDKFAVPFGDTNSRDSTPEAGTTRFNQDFGTLEFFDGNNWKTVNSYSRGGAAGRAVTGSGYDNPGYTYTIDYVNIATRGNSAYFGDLSNPTASQNYNYAACSSSIRGLFGGGANQPGSDVTDVISYITIAAGGNCIDFGNLTDARTYCRGFSSSTRALFGGGYDPSNSNIVDYVEIGTLGNALDFGNLSVVGSQKMACSSPTRGLFAGGGPTYIAAIDSFQIATLGDAQDFGDLTQRRGGGGGCSNATRGVFMGGEMSTPSTVRVDTIDFVSISSFGNAIDFGNLSSSRAYSGATSNSVRGLALGGIPMTNSIEYISISTAGNAEDFGDLVVPRYGVQSLSDSHGGLGGF